MKRRAIITLILFASVIVFVEIVVRFLPVYDYADPQEYYLHQKGVELREGTENYEIILLGDSRSMALRRPVEGLSFYNFSVPGMGNRYYTVLLKRYLSTGRKPKLILLAPHQQGLLTQPERPSLELKYDDGLDLSQALSQMISRRIHSPLFVKNTNANQGVINAAMFAPVFRDGRLHFLGYADSVRVFVGWDRLIQAYEGAPFLYRTYFLRTPILNMLQNPGRKGSLQGCDACDAIYQGICHDRLQPADHTDLVANSMSRYGGAFNLDDLASPSGRIALHLTRSQAIAGMATGLNSERRDFPTQTLEELVAFATSQGIKIVFLELPLPERVSKARQVPVMRTIIQTVLARYEGTGYKQFPTLNYPESRYVDPFHLSCYGAADLNNDFQKVFPSIESEYLEHSRDF